MFPSTGKISKFLCFHKYVDSFYIHGGQDLKEGSYGDLWRVNYEFIHDENVMRDEQEVEDIKWEEIKLTGKFP